MLVCGDSGMLGKLAAAVQLPLQPTSSPAQATVSNQRQEARSTKSQQTQAFFRISIHIYNYH